MTSALSILVVEDETDIAANIGDYLMAQGHEVDFAYSGTQGLELALNCYFDVIVLDIMLPGLDGLQVCQQLRAQSTRHIPIIMLTARDTLDDKLCGFKQGADDYLTKPFALAELLVRIEALSMRHRVATDHVLEIGELKINRHTQSVERAQSVISLSNLHYQILLAIAESHPKPLSRSDLMTKVWGAEPPESDALRSHIYQIRKQLDKPLAYDMLATLHGVGFAFKVKNC